MDWLYFFDLFGTAVFAASGALKAYNHRFDIFGMSILGLTTAVGGGTIRDLLLGKSPPFWITDPTYFLVAIAVSLTVFWWRGTLEKRKWLFYFCDAVGLGVFTAVGANVAAEAGLGLLGILTAGVLTATGGGALRDVFVNEKPLIFRSELYASSSLAGGVLFWLLFENQINLELNALATAIFVISFRLISIRKKWHLPRAKLKFKK